MTGLELRTCLAKMGLSQVQFARQLGVTTRAVTLWLGEERSIPGPVEAYLRLFTMAPAAVRLTEVQRFNESESNMRDGMYSIQYSSPDVGHAIGGFGFVIFDSGKVFGGDPFGAVYNGEYSYDEARALENVTLKLTFAAGANAVFGVTNPYEWSIDATATMDPHVDVGTTMLTTSLRQTISAEYRFIRSLPVAA